MITVLSVIYIGAAFVSAAAAVLVWRRRALPTGRPLMLLLLAAAFWALLDALELRATTIEGKRFVSQLQYLSITTVAPLYFHVAFSLARRTASLTRPVLLAVWGIPVLTLLIAWTSHWHGLLWRDITIPDLSTNLGVYHYGPWFWVLVAHNYVVFAVATIVLIAAARQVTRPFRGPFAVGVFALLLPWIGNVAYVFKLGPWPGLNWFSISIIVTGSMLGWLVTGEGLLDILPRAREAIVDSMRDGVIVLDAANRMLFANQAARDLLGAAAIEGRTPVELLRLIDGYTGPREREWPDPSGEMRWLDISADVVRDRWNEVAGRLITLRDITHRHVLELDRDRLIDELTRSGRLSTLEGLLPICANCKRVREDDGSWSALDHYVSRQMEVEFSHGLCPDCVVGLYPEHG